MIEMGCRSETRSQPALHAANPRLGPNHVRLDFSLQCSLANKVENRNTVTQLTNKKIL